MIVTILRRDRAVVLTGLAVVTGLAWFYLVTLAAGMDGMSAAMTEIQPWSTGDFLLMILMWSVMQAGMMIPGATPFILLFALVSRKQREKGRDVASVGTFVLGYVAVWGGFSVLAASLQWGLQQAALVSPMMVSASPLLGGGLLIGAGIYQLTPAKRACLGHCRTPMDFLTRRWRRGAGGAVVMGMEHGAYCVGCCWALMLLLFVGGVMNLLWIAAIGVFVLIEKAAPFGAATGRLTAGLLILSGAYFIGQHVVL